MKAFLIEGDNGLDYDDYEHWITNVFLVPDDFDPIKVRFEAGEKLKRDGSVRITKNGHPYFQDRVKFERSLLEYMKENYQELEIVSNE